MLRPPALTGAQQQSRLIFPSVQYTNKGDPAPEDTEPESNTDTSKLQTENELTIGDAGFYSTRAPLMVEIVSTMTGLKTLEGEWQVELDPCLHTL